MSEQVRTFDLTGPLPAPATTTVLEASAGTGKTFALAGLVTRMVAEGRATLDEMLLITFGRAASQELRERVRGQIVGALAAFADPAAADNDLLRHLIAEDREARHERLRDALAGFDAATIASAFLVSPATMGQRLTRAKNKIRQAGIPFRVPERTDLRERLDSVLEAIYAAFAEGWSDPAGTEIRRLNLSEEGIGL